VVTAVRLATLVDAGHLSRLAHLTFHQAFASYSQMPANALQMYLDTAFTVPQVILEINDVGSTFLLAEIDREPVGYAKLISNSYERCVEARNPIMLKRLYVRQEYQGRGIGADLLLNCIDLATSTGHDAIWLTVWEHNTRAQSFYSAWNFKKRGIIDFQLGATTLTDIVMQKLI
jgi:diamine N-acetyltransferase